jgi:nitrate/TMAO reductase-like tetraheme cytochrome c subunit
MSKVRFEFNEKGFEQVAQDAVNKFAEQHQNECIICHKPIQNDEPLKPGMVPVHRECAEKEGLI